MPLVCEITNEISFVRNPSQKLFAAVTTVTDDAMLKAYDYKLRNKDICKLSRMYFIPARERTNLSLADCEQYMSTREWPTLDDFFMSISSFYMVTIDNSNWQNSQCTCNDSLKHNQCPHIIVEIGRAHV